MEASRPPVSGGTSRVQFDSNRKSYQAKGGLLNLEYSEARFVARHCELEPHLVPENTRRTWQ